MSTISLPKRVLFVLGVISINGGAGGSWLWIKPPGPNQIN